MKKILLVLLCISVYSNAITIDKGKILSIIRAAKKGESLPADTINEKKENTIIVYRKKSTLDTNKQAFNHKVKLYQSKLIKSSLPNIPPTSIILRNKMLTNNTFIKKERDTQLFKTPRQNKYKKENTRAKKINYY